MRDGQTRKIDRSGLQGQVFLHRNRAMLVIVEGPASGSEYALDQDAVTLGRGEGVDLRFDDEAMSNAHAALELTRDGFKIRDLGSTNGTFVNGSRVQASELKHGDRVQLGDHIFQYIVDRRESGPRTYDLSGEI